ncbi:SgcJ/EcaC family oxidoreductase [Jeongeupia wiesaeckerbachi]|uniref:YybH family protein n=1 Tax=Jeongeupia wiesaeckerbachi TaxID=3051218 RepID=UPI003D805D4E
MDKQHTEPFAQALAAYKAAVFTKDADAFAALYGDDVTVFDMWGAWALHGQPAWRAMAVDWFASLGDERVEVDFTAVQTTQNDGIAAGHAIATYTAIAADGKVLRAQSNRITMILKRADTVWHIIHEHTSAPLDPGSQRVMLDQPG